MRAGGHSLRRVVASLWVLALLSGCKFGDTVTTVSVRDRDYDFRCNGVAQALLGNRVPAEDNVPMATARAIRALAIAEAVAVRFEHHQCDTGRGPWFVATNRHLSSRSIDRILSF